MRLLLTTSLQLLHQPPLFHDSTKLKMLNSGSNNNNNNGTAMDDSIQALEITSPVNRTLNSGNKDKDKKAAATTTRYRECQKNHAASLGSHAVDGCGEFMPLGEEGTLDALKCAACGCHRNFHRREVEGEIATCDCHKKDAKKRGIQQVSAAATAMAYPSSVTQFQQGHKLPMTPIPMMAMSTGAADSDEQEGGEGVGGGGGIGGSSPSNIKKRFRTKFSTEQKDEMYNFAEKLGWKMQKHDELAVQEFCANLGVKRHVLKVWMHNNKHTMAKKT